MYDLVKSRAELLEFILGMADRFDIAFVISLFCPQHSIDGSSMSEVIGFQHVDQEVDRGTGVRSNRLQHRIKRHSVSLKDFFYLVSVVVLQIIDQDDVIEVAGKIPPGKQPDFFVAVGNPFCRYRRFFVSSFPT